MPLARDDSASPNLIRGYSPGEIRTATQRFTTSCILTSDRVISPWPPTDVASLTNEHLAPLYDLRPSIFLLAIDGTVQFPRAEIRAVLARRGIGLETMGLGAGCRTFNVLVTEQRSVAIGVLLSQAPGTGAAP